MVDADGGGEEEAAEDEAAEPAPGSTLRAELVEAAEAVGIDIAFLEALPPELRVEVFAQYGATLPPSAFLPPTPQVRPPASTFYLSERGIGSYQRLTFCIGNQKY